MVELSVLAGKKRNDENDEGLAIIEKKSQVFMKIGFVYKSLILKYN